MPMPRYGLPPKKNLISKYPNGTSVRQTWNAVRQSRNAVRQTWNAVRQTRNAVRQT